jgi:hypothetical protein
VFILLFEPLPAVGQWISTRISEFENGVIELVDRRREKKLLSQKRQQLLIFQIVR